MSSSLDRMTGTDEPAPFVPKGTRDGAHAARNMALTVFENFEDEDLSQIAASEAVPATGVVIDGFRLPRSFEPTLLLGPWPEFRSLSGMLGRLALAIAVAVVIAFIAVGKPSTSGATKSSDESSLLLPRFQRETPASAARPSRLAPKLVVGQLAPRGTGGALPVGMPIRGAGGGAFSGIRGLANGATVSPGSSTSDNGWHASAPDFNSLPIRPSREFAGPMDLTVESRLADGTLADRTPLRFEWAGTAVADAKPNAHSVPQLDADDLAALLKRGDELMASGDLAAARLVLQRAADAGDARAAWTLAGTYDPVVLEKLRVHGLAPNVAKARSWYERAKQLGEPRQLVDVSE